MTKGFKRVISLIITVVIMASLVNVPLVSAAESISDWTVTMVGGCDGSVTVDNETFYRGNGSMHIIDNTPTTANVYIRISQNVNLTKGKTYYFGCKAKANKVVKAMFTFDWTAKYSLTPFGDTYDWTNFEFVYTPKETKEYTLYLLVDGLCNDLWVDDMIFIDAQTGENLLKNPSFDTEVKEVVERDPIVIGDGSLETIYNTITSSDAFYAADYRKTMGAFRYFPVQRAEGIVVDGDLGDWAEYQSLSMPTLSTQYQIYIEDERPLDAEGECKIAYDDEALYLAVAVKDDVYHYVEGSGYWKGDSLQLAISDLNEAYGSEIGFAYNPETGKGEVYSSALSIEARDLIKCEGSREGDMTYYEIMLPWSVKTGRRPDNMLFDILINDNDGDGRRYCVELAPGIAEGKTNQKFPKVVLGDGTSDCYAWVQGDRSCMEGGTGSYEYYLVNESEEEISYTVTNSLSGASETVKLAAGTGIRRSFSQKFDTYGDYELKIDCVSDKNTVSTSMDITVERQPATVDTAKALIAQLEKQAKDLKTLISRCTEKGISTDYENIAYELISLWSTYVQEDVDNNVLDRIYYQEETTNKIYTEAKASLQAYLNGTKTPIEVPRYVMSDQEVVGKNIWATNEYNGKLEKRPTFFVGYGHTPYWYAEYMPMFKSMGTNAVQMENSLNSSMNLYGFGGWKTTVYNKAQGSMAPSAEEAHSGERSAKLTFTQDQKANTYWSLTQTVYNVKPGRIYEFKAYVKAKNASQIQLFCNGWATAQRIKTDAGTYDWKEYKIEFEVPEGQTQTSIMLNIDNRTEAVYIDDVSFTDKETGENLIADGGFENDLSKEEFPFSADSAGVKENIYLLEQAEKNDLAVDLLFGPHNVDDALIEKYDMGVSQSGFIKYNIDAPAAREMIEKWLRFVCPILNKYDAVKTVCISNEPMYYTHAFGDFYLDEWRELLNESYDGDISYLNRAWGTEYRSFDEVDFSGISFDGCDNQAKFSDYRELNNRVLSRWHKWMYDIVKEYFPDTPVHSKIMSFDSYNSQSGFKKNTWNGTGLAEYDFLDANGCDAWDYGYVWGYHLSEELWYDYMTSLNDAPVINSEDHIIPDKHESFDLDIADYMNKIIWQGAIRGRAISDIWHWKRRYTKTDNAWNSVLFRPDAVYQIEKTRFDVNRLAYQIVALQDEEREVGIIQSHDSMINDTSASHSMYQAYAAASFNGKRVMFVTEDNVEAIYDCKMVIVPRTVYITHEQLDALKTYIENGGKVLIMGKESLARDDKNLENDKATVDYIFENSEVIEYRGTSGAMISPSTDELYAKVREMLRENGLYYVEVRDAETDMPIDMVEYNIGVYDGKVLVNLVNYRDEDVAVKVLVDGKLVEKAVELRSEEEIDTADGIELTRYVPILLELDAENRFFDTYGHWAEEDIVSLADSGIVKGVSESRYNPNSSVTRAEFLSLLMRTSNAAGGIYGGEFEDVKSDDWFASDVAKALQMNVIDARSNFFPYDKITREEMCDMLVRAYEYANGEITSENKSGFTDADKINDIDCVEKAVGAGLMLGREDNSFDPTGNATRAEAAAVISRYIK